MTSLADVRPQVRNSPLLDPRLYAAQQNRLFDAGRFAFVDIALVAGEDQVFLELGRGPARTVEATRLTLGATETETWVDYRPDPDLEPADRLDGEQFGNGERVFARRPANDRRGRGLSNVLLELPADMGPDGKPIPPPDRLTRRALLMAVVEKARGLRSRPTLPIRV